MIDSVGVSGKWHCTIKRANGNTESFEQPNTIHANLKDVIADTMNAVDSDFDLNSSLHANDGSGQGSNSSSLSKIANGGAGISMTITTPSSGTHYGMSTSLETGATATGSGYYAEWRGTVRVTLTYVITAIFLGRGGNSGQTAFDTIYATGDSWSSVTLDDGDQMDIVWKVTVS